VRHASTGESVGAGQDILTGAAPCYDVCAAHSLSLSLSRPLTARARSYRTRDGHVSVGALEPKFWSALVRALGLEEIEALAFAVGEEGRAARAKLQAALAQRSGEELRALLGPVDCCVEVVARPEGVLEGDPQLRARALLLDVQVGAQRVSERSLSLSLSPRRSPAASPPAAPQLRVPKTPLCMDGVRFRETCGPALGEHNEELLGPIRARL
jgi:crotonobetainyl-CoA:carnitine CoA-transferase CaiB-like acyl-CoA transferase